MKSQQVIWQDSCIQKFKEGQSKYQMLINTSFTGHNGAPLTSQVSGNGKSTNSTGSSNMLGTVDGKTTKSSVMHGKSKTLK